MSRIPGIPYDGGIGDTCAKRYVVELASRDDCCIRRLSTDPIKIPRKSTMRPNLGILEYSRDGG